MLLPEADHSRNSAWVEKPIAMISTWGDLIRALASIHVPQALQVLFPALVPALVWLRSTLDFDSEVRNREPRTLARCPRNDQQLLSRSPELPPSESSPSAAARRRRSHPR